MANGPDGLEVLALKALAVRHGQIFEVENRLATDGLGGCAKGGLIGSIAAEESGLRVLDEDRVGDAVDQGALEGDLVGQFGLGVASLGDVPDRGTIDAGAVIG